MSGRQRTHLWLRYIREEWIYIFDSCWCCENCERGKGIYNCFVVHTVMYEFELLSVCTRFISAVCLLQSSMIQVHSCKEQGIIPAPGDVVTAKVR
jgi:hypothetical protein